MRHLLHRGTGAGVGGRAEGKEEGDKPPRSQSKGLGQWGSPRGRKDQGDDLKAATPGQPVPHPGQSHTAPHTRISVNLRASLKHRPLLCMSFYAPAG